MLSALRHTHENKQTKIPKKQNDRNPIVISCSFTLMAQIPIYLFEKLFPILWVLSKLDLQVRRQVLIYPNVMLSFITCQETYLPSLDLNPSMLPAVRLKHHLEGHQSLGHEFLLRSLHEACERTSWNCHAVPRVIVDSLSRFICGVLPWFFKAS